MSKRTFRVAPGAAGQRLDVYLARRVPDFTRSQFQRFIDKERVVVNGVHRKSSYAVRPGDEVEVDIEIPEKEGIVPEDISLAVLYADDDIIVIDKPSGMAVHPGAGTRVESNALFSSSVTTPGGMSIRIGPG